jgi:hypothetical protein
MLTTQELQSVGFVEIEADVWAVSFDPAGEYRWPHRVTTLAEVRRIATAYGHPLTEAV